MLQRTNIYLEKQEINYYKDTAKKCGVTMSDVIRQDLRKQKTLGNTGSNWTKSLLKWAEKPATDIEEKTDIGRRHDYYLYEYDVDKRNKKKQKNA